MLSVLAGLYIWHLPSFVNQGVTTGDAIGVWYQRFMFIGNFSVGAFITIAACTRLVFPALSLEGKSLWIVQTAPISVREVIRLKMGIWIVPIATLSLALFTLGALYVGVSGLVIAVYGFTSLAIAYGVVGSACGLGARYARFDWEHPSQLCAGFGSLVYMIYSCALVTLSVFPTWAILFKTSDSFLAGAMNGSDLQLLLGNGMLIILINVVGAQLALRWGEYELRKSLGRGL
jgi:ABC-2 type transport system permease protein